MPDTPVNSSPPLVDAAISTMWGIGRFDHLSDFFDQATEIGFAKFELNHKVSSQMLAGIELEDYMIPVVHEPCPADIDAQILRERDWLVSSLDETNRIAGVRIVQRSIDLAYNLGSDMVVVHCGHIPGLREMENPLWALFQAGKTGTPEYQEVKDGLLRAKADRTAPVLEAVQRSLAELAEYARPFGVRLGLENRYRFSDFPGLDEMEALLDSQSEEIFGFWYDVGHAQALDQLGFYPHEAWPRRFGTRLFGAHLHDVKVLEDHHVPGLGDVDWNMVASYLSGGIYHTLEVQNFNSLQQIRDGIQFLIDKKCLFYL